MPEFADIYALGQRRSPDAILGFLDYFLPARTESSDEYGIPWDASTPHTVFQTAGELIKYCCDNPNVPSVIYWRSTVEEMHAEVHFLSDGGVIFGVSTPAADHAKVDALSNQMGRFLATDEVFVTYEDVPPDSVAAFHSFRAGLPIIVDAASAETARQTRAHRPIQVESSRGANSHPPPRL